MNWTPSTQDKGVKPRSLELRGSLDPRGSPFETLYESEFAYVWHSLRRLGIRDADLPDLSHDVFVKAFSSFAEYDPARPLRPWLFGIALRVASDFRRLARHQREVFGRSLDRPDQARNAAERIEATEDRQLVLKILDELEISRRVVFVMHELNGHSVREISDALEVPLNTVYSRLRLAWLDFGRRARRLKLLEVCHE
jgi:RNA polymerase sigma-70 factor (ECF subfamily)